MALLKEWQKIAYDEKKDKGALQRFWANYFNLEKGVGQSRPLAVYRRCLQCFRQ